MGIISWLVLGAIVGFTANLIMDERDGVLGTIGLGVAGSLLGGVLATAVGAGDIGGMDTSSIVVAVIGACILIAVGRLIAGRPAEA